MDLSKIEFELETEEMYWVLYNDVEECFFTQFVTATPVLMGVCTNASINNAKHFTFKSAVKILKEFGASHLKDYKLVKVLYNRKEKFTPALESPELPRPSIDDYMKEI